MNSPHVTAIAKELALSPHQIEGTLELLDNDATVPFIARYRKEATGSLDEVAITTIRERIGQLRELDKRREAILKSLTERDLLTDELKQKIIAAKNMTTLEDIYLPFRPKRRTKATIARERGLEPLAELVFTQDDINLQIEATAFVDPEKEIETVEDAMAGARDIVAEWVNEDADARARIRELFRSEGTIHSTVIPGKEETGVKFSDYFDWEEAVMTAPSHRILAMRRGENEKVLSLRIGPSVESALGILTDIFVIAENAASGQVRLAVEDSYKRLLAPAMENEIRVEIKKVADEEAIRVFAENVRELLMAAPLGQKRLLAIDPGFRTGCKVVCLDPQGKLLDNTTIFPHKSDRERDDAARDIKALVEKFKTQVIVIGNGTAGRETETFIRELGLPEHIVVEMVSEAGASVYSASDVAREEFPNYDITVRGAVSIGRRLMDPLAELVKIDPKSIGVGQYQHDVDQGSLKNRLDDVVGSCVNAVGVEVNTASKQLLTYVSGLGPQLAGNIVSYRDEHGPFKSRKILKKVNRLGPKAFEQAAGFLRISDAEDPLDSSAVHPESYPVVYSMAEDIGCSVADLMRDESLREKINLRAYENDTIGMPTLMDIKEELAKPGRDPRASYEAFSFDSSVKAIDDLEIDMVLPGVVTNVTAFGAFVDIGVHQDGLVHISELADQFVKDPSEIVKVGQRVKVTVLNIDHDRSRISLSMREKKN
ncbi:MAG: RNA-binding transcriptional accessory protein [Candidatus Zixiibacteriota bacterium]|nr:MAG: RNA-binding transcriptional accessory protein [candidate division Zixibacteria bacterium]